MITPVSDGVVITVRVIPRAAASGVAGTRGGALLVRLSAPPVEGAANEELIDVIAKTLGVGKRAVTLIAGARAREKRIHVAGISAEDTVAILAP